MHAVRASPHPEAARQPVLNLWRTGLLFKMSRSVRYSASAFSPGFFKSGFAHPPDPRGMLSVRPMLALWQPRLRAPAASISAHSV